MGATAKSAVAGQFTAAMNRPARKSPKLPLLGAAAIAAVLLARADTRRVALVQLRHGTPMKVVLRDKTPEQVVREHPGDALLELAAAGPDAPLETYERLLRKYPREAATRAAACIRSGALANGIFMQLPVIADYLKLSPAQVEAQMRSGNLRATKVGTHYHLNPDDFYRLVPPVFGVAKRSSPAEAERKRVAERQAIELGITAAREGIELDSQNAFFDWMLADLLLGQDIAAAVAALHDGALKCQWNDYGLAQLRSTHRLRELQYGGLDPQQRWIVTIEANGTRVRQGAPQRQLARVAAGISDEQRIYYARKWVALRLDLMKLALLMQQSDTNTVIDSMVGTAVLHIASSFRLPEDQYLPEYVTIKRRGDEFHKMSIEYIMPRLHRLDSFADAPHEARGVGGRECRVIAGVLADADGCPRRSHLGAASRAA